MLVIVPTFATSTDLAPLWGGFGQFIGVLTSPEMQSDLFPLKVLFGFCGIGFIIIIVYMLSHTEWLEWSRYGDAKDFLTAGQKILGITNQKNIQAWSKIKKGLNKDYEAQWKVSTIEAVTFLEKFLENAGYAGASLKERIDGISSEDVSNLEKLKQASDVYSAIIADPKYHLEKHKAEEVILDVG
ncbi:MAG: hypothetical protein NTV62_03230 [Candidatus Gribaldobacteria bacterium]|nr:hypothetical protein [Candidatus Gribaldobacteria bacterium]